MKTLLTDASVRAIRYLESLETRSVAPTPAALDALRTLNEPLPAHPSDPAKTLQVFDEMVSPATTAMKCGLNITSA